MLPIAAGFLLYAGTIVAVGAMAFPWFVTSRVALPPEARASFERRSVALVRLGAAAALVGAGLDLADQLATFRDPFVPLRDDLELLVGRTTWGKAWSARTLAALLLLLLPLPGPPVAYPGSGAVRPGRSSWLRRLRWSVAAGAGLVLAGAPAFSGHALGSPRLTELAVAADTVHVLAASVWIGGIGCLLLAARAGDSGGGGLPEVSPASDAGRTHTGADGARISARILPLARLVDAFSPLALGCGAAVVATGLFQSWLHVGGMQGLDSPYGRTLLAKLVLVTGVLAAGAFNWRRVRPALRAGDRGLFRRSGTVEFLFAQAVLLATAVLTNLSPPS